MKRFIVGGLVISLSTSSFAIMGVGDLTFDPTSYSVLTKQYEEVLNLYKAAKAQMGKLQDIESTIKEAQEVYKTLSTMDLKRFAEQMKVSPGSSKSIAAMNAEIDRIEATGKNNADYIAAQRARIAQLANLDTLEKASSGNIKDASSAPNAATSAAITAQSTAALAALASAEEQRRVQEDFERKQAEETTKNKFIESSGVYKALGK